MRKYLTLLIPLLLLATSAFAQPSGQGYQGPVQYSLNCALSLRYGSVNVCRDTTLNEWFHWDSNLNHFVADPGPSPLGPSSVNLVINVQAPPYNASGSDQSFTCTVAPPGTLICTRPTDFIPGQWVMVEGAGPASPLTAASAVTPTSVGAAGTTDIKYIVLAVDPAGGSAAASSAGDLPTGPATFSPQAGVKVAFTGNGNANSGYVIYRSVNGGAYTCRNIVGGTPYYDMGQAGNCKDWPATPPGSPLPQAFWTQITQGAGSVWNVSPVPAATITGLTRHDDTQGIQAAHNAACAQGGAEVYYPLGHYHVNQYALFNSSPNIAGYAFNSTTSGYEAYGNIILQCSHIEVAGAGEGRTTFVHDFPVFPAARGHIFSMVALGYTSAPGLGPQNADGTLAFTPYPINNATRGSHVITTATAGNAANFQKGHLTYVTGGLPQDGNYTMSFISPVTSIDTATGNINLRDGLGSDIPYGAPGVMAQATDLTANNGVLTNMTFRDFTVDTGGAIVAFTASYNDLIERVNTIGPPLFNGQPIYGQWFSKLRLEDVDWLSGGQTQFTIGSYLEVHHSRFGQAYGWQWTGAPEMFISFQGGVSPLSITDNTFYDGCNNAVAISQGSNGVTFSNNQIYQSCTGIPVEPSGTNAALRVGTLQAAPAGYTPYDWSFVGNTIESWWNSTILGSAGIQNLNFSNNILVSNGRNVGSTNMVYLEPGGSLKFTGNHLTANGVVNSDAFMIYYRQDLPGSQNGQADFSENTLVQQGTDDLTGIFIGDPGSVVPATIRIENNHMTGITNPLPFGLRVQSVTDSTGIVQFGNVMENVTNPFNPVSVACMVPPEAAHQWAGQSSSVPAMTSAYMGFGQPYSILETLEGSQRWQANNAYICKLYCNFSSIASGSGIAFTVFKSGTPSTLTCTATSGSSCTDNHAQFLSGLFGLDLLIQNNENNPTGSISCVFQVESAF